MKFPALPKISSKGFTRAIFHEMAPDLLKGFIKEIANEEDPLDAYDNLMKQDLWDLLPQERKPYLVNMKPWDLSWLSVDWIFDVLKECSPELATLLATSPAFQKRLGDQITKIKEILT